MAHETIVQIPSWYFESPSCNKVNDECVIRPKWLHPKNPVANILFTWTATGDRHENTVHLGTCSETCCYCWWHECGWKTILIENKHAQGLLYTIMNLHDLRWTSQCYNHNNWNIWTNFCTSRMTRNKKKKWQNSTLTTKIIAWNSA